MHTQCGSHVLYDNILEAEAGFRYLFTTSNLKSGFKGERDKVQMKQSHIILEWEYSVPIVYMISGRFGSLSHYE